MLACGWVWFSLVVVCFVGWFVDLDVAVVVCLDLTAWVGVNSVG